MKKLALLISTTLLMGTQAFASVAGSATPPPSGSASADIFAIVPEACSVVIVNQAAIESDIFSAEQQTVSSPVRLICNTVNGASVSLSSEEGALRQPERDIWADYTATLGLSDSGAAAADLVLEADARAPKATPGVSVTRAFLTSSQSYPLDISLDSGQELLGGRYEDRLTITLTAN